VARKRNDVRSCDRLSNRAVQSPPDRLGIERVVAEEPGVELDLERLDLLPDVCVGIVLAPLVLSLELFHLVKEPLDVASTGESELLLLDFRDPTRTLEVLDAQ
jgi:hypothetical protein